MVITISRQHGSGGRLIGRLLADKLSFGFYDREILQSRFLGSCSYENRKEAKSMLRS